MWYEVRSESGEGLAHTGPVAMERNWDISRVSCQTVRMS